jgi:hypothetical protein
MLFQFVCLSRLTFSSLDNLTDKVSTIERITLLDLKITYRASMGCADHKFHLEQVSTVNNHGYASRAYLHC